MGRQLDELCFVFWRPAIYVTSLCYCFTLLANKLMHDDDAWPIE